MKKLYTILFLLFFSIVAFSQIGQPANRLRVYNYTPCPQYFVVISKTTNLCQCTGETLADFVIIPPATLPTNPTEMSFAGYITHVRIPEGPYCGGQAVGQPSCAGTGVFLSCSYNAKDEDCKICSENPKTLATWTSGSCNEPAVLTFTNL